MSYKTATAFQKIKRDAMNMTFTATQMPMLRNYSYETLTFHFIEKSLRVKPNLLIDLWQF